jgi:uncharacterized membrane protein
MQNLMSRIPYLLWAISSFAGFINASYLTVQHYNNAYLNCSEAGCETVLTSNYSSVGGVPLSIFGALFFLLMLVLLALKFQTGQEKYIAIALSLATLGTLTTLYLVYLQLFEIKSVCSYCMFSALNAFLLFAVAVYLNLKKKRGQLFSD